MKLFIGLLVGLFLSVMSSGQSYEVLSDSLIQYYNLGDYKRAIAVGKKTIIAAKEKFGKDASEYAATLNDMGLLYQAVDQYEKAEALHIEALAIRKKTLGITHPDYAFSMSDLALVYTNTSQYEKAEPLFIEAMAILKKTKGPDNPEYATSLNNLAGMYYNTGHYEKAEPLFIAAMVIRKKALGPEDPDYAASLSNLANVYISIGQYKKAEPLFIEAITIAKKTMGLTHPDYARILNSQASLYQKMHQYTTSEALYTEAKEIWKKTVGTANELYASALNNLANLYLDMGQYQKAEPLLSESAGIYKSIFGPTSPSYARSLMNIALYYKYIGEYEKAASLYIESLAIWKKVMGTRHPDYVTCQRYLAFTYQDMDQYEKAEPLLLENSLIELQNLRNTFSILSEEEKQNYLMNYNTQLPILNSFIFRYRKASPATLQNNFNQHLVFKSIALADTRTFLTTVKQSSDTTVQNILALWQNKKRILAKEYSLPVSRRRTDLKKIEEESEDLEKELSRISADFRKQLTAISISFKDVQNSLQQNEAAIEFVRFRIYNKKWTDSTMYGAYILKKTDSVPDFVPLFEEKQLLRLLDSSGSSATARAKIFYRGLQRNNHNTRQGQLLYNLVWHPLESRLTGIDKVSYSPAGKLFSIAFHALPVEGESLLMEKYRLQQYISTRQVALRNSEKQTARPESIVLFGDADFSMDSSALSKQRKDLPDSYVSRSLYTPSLTETRNSSWPSLPGTAEEVNMIKQLFERNKIMAQTFLQTAASEANLKGLSGHSPQILHIATHGFFLQEPDKTRKNSEVAGSNAYTFAENPLLRSGLILAGGNYAWSAKTPIEGVEDGIVTAYEISQLDLSNTELVVLSACETGLGDVKGAEGVFGLQRAFKMAGVKKMLVSLWNVPDKETAELMNTFYSYLMKGKTINDAFAQAQADMRKKYSPFYWAAFVLVE